MNLYEELVEAEKNFRWSPFFAFFPVASSAYIVAVALIAFQFFPAPWNWLFLSGAAALLGSSIYLVVRMHKNNDKRGRVFVEARTSWAEAHGLDPKQNLPSRFALTSDYPEEIFSQRIDGRLRTYRLYFDGESTRLYGEDGMEISPKETEPQKPEFYPENDALWQASQAD